MSEKNPIPFNPDTMTVSQLKWCADTLRMLFDGVERPDVDDSNVMHHLRQAREWADKNWSARSVL